MKSLRTRKRLLTLFSVALALLVAVGSVGVVSAGPEDDPDPTPNTNPVCPDSATRDMDETLLLLRLFMDVGEAVLF